MIFRQTRLSYSEFSHDELRDVIEESNEWNKFALEHIRKSLQESGKEITSEDLEKKLKVLNKFSRNLKMETA